MLPFLKHREEAVADGNGEDDKTSFSMIDAIVDDLLEAVAKKDKGLLKSTLEAFVEHIRDLDQEQDETNN